MKTIVEGGSFVPRYSCFSRQNVQSSQCSVLVLGLNYDIDSDIGYNDLSTRNTFDYLCLRRIEQIAKHNMHKHRTSEGEKEAYLGIEITSNMNRDTQYATMYRPLPNTKLPSFIPTWSTIFPKRGQTQLLWWSLVRPAKWSTITT